MEIHHLISLFPTQEKISPSWECISSLDFMSINLLEPLKDSKNSFLKKSTNVPIFRFIEGDNIDVIDSIHVKAYEPAFGIIGDPAKRDPHTR